MDRRNWLIRRLIFVFWYENFILMLIWYLNSSIWFSKYSRPKRLRASHENASTIFCILVLYYIILYYIYKLFIHSLNKQPFTISAHKTSTVNVMRIYIYFQLVQFIKLFCFKKHLALMYFHNFAVSTLPEF